MPKSPAVLTTATPALEKQVSTDGTARPQQHDVLPGGSLSVIIPFYNEARTIEFVIERIRATGLPGEIIVVDDGSTDDTFHRLSKLRSVPGLSLCATKAIAIKVLRSVRSGAR